MFENDFCLERPSRIESQSAGLNYEHLPPLLSSLLKKQGFILLDGGTGTELEKKFDLKLDKELWSSGLAFYTDEENLGSGLNENHFVQKEENIEKDFIKISENKKTGKMIPFQITRGSAKQSDIKNPNCFLVGVHYNYLAQGLCNIVTCATYQASVDRLVEKLKEIRNIEANKDHSNFNDSVANDSDSNLILAAKCLIRNIIDSTIVARDMHWYYANFTNTSDQEDLNRKEGNVLSQVRQKEKVTNKALVVTSLGNYGAYLANGSEYTGQYNLSFHALENWHKERFELFLELSFGYQGQYDIINKNEDKDKDKEGGKDKGNDKEKEENNEANKKEQQERNDINILSRTEDKEEEDNSLRIFTDEKVTNNKFASTAINSWLGLPTSDMIFQENKWDPNELPSNEGKKANKDKFDRTATGTQGLGDPIKSHNFRDSIESQNLVVSEKSKNFVAEIHQDVDGLIYETIPSLKEFKAILSMLRKKYLVEKEMDAMNNCSQDSTYTNSNSHSLSFTKSKSIDSCLRQHLFWISFAFQDGEHLNSGESVHDLCDILYSFDEGYEIEGAENEREVRNITKKNAAANLKLPFLIFPLIGINCTNPYNISELIGRFKKERAINGKRGLIVYPNSGEEWLAKEKRWNGHSVFDVDHPNLILEWIAHGVFIQGGCCRVRPEHLRKLHHHLKVNTTYSIEREILSEVGVEP